MQKMQCCTISSGIDKKQNTLLQTVKGLVSCVVQAFLSFLESNILTINVALFYYINQSQH